MSGPTGWLALRFRDFDAFGHVYHAEYLTLLDEARTGWFAALLGVDDPSGYVVAHLEIDYLSSLTRDEDAVRGEFSLERVGGIATDHARGTDTGPMGEVLDVARPAACCARCAA